MIVLADSPLGVLDTVRRARDGVPLSPEAIAHLVAGAATGSVPDYQLAAFLMAVYQRGLSDADTASLTCSMRDSGTVIRWPNDACLRVDKHSTGGVGDKISIHLAPWIAACGVPVPMVCGRGLGHTGGTLDKLDSIPGFSHALSVARFRQLVQTIGVAIMGQSAEFAPADGRLYALRDVTATVESVPLITASILSKKLAEGIDALVLDVKVGAGAFMKTLEQGQRLAESIVRVGRLAGLRVCAVLSAMEAPLGQAIGNALEVQESIDVLRGGGPADVLALSYALGSRMVWMSGKAASLGEGRQAMQRALESGAAWARFCTLVRAQGGQVDPDAAVPIALPQAPLTTTLRTQHAGRVRAIDAYRLGVAAVGLGAGRALVTDAVDPAVGLVLSARVGDAVGQGDPLLVVHHRAPLTPLQQSEMQGAIAVDEQVGSQPPAQPPAASLIIGEFGADAP